MFIDARTYPDKEFHADICIVGAGAAGITIADKLRNSGASVCLVESGGLEPNADTQHLYKGDHDLNVHSYSEKYLSQSRARYFGGTTNLWRGWCRPLDAVDFEEREWLPYSGWPITRKDLDPYYLEAARYLQIQPFDGRVDEGIGVPLGHTILNNSVVSTKRFHFSPPTRFGEVYRQNLEQAQDLHVFLHANVTNIAMRKDGNAVDHLEVRTLSENRFTIRARFYVLACGGIEAPRLLLASRDVHGHGVGNSNGLVGRFFMDHPHMRRCGEIVLTRPTGKFTEYDRLLVDSRPGRTLSVICPTEQTLHKYRMPNISVQIERYIRKLDDVERVARAFSYLDRSRLNARQRDTAEVFSGQFYIRGEQRPDPANRVTLGRDRDALGMQRVNLRWHLAHEDSHNFHTIMKVIGTELLRLTSGRVRLFVSDDEPWNEVYGGSHHIGTARMSRVPQTGVVDSQCRMHEVPNLYISSSAVFPTGGFANPTLTIVALAARLADHLVERLKAA